MKHTLARLSALGIAVLCLAPQTAIADEAPPLSIYGFARFDFIVDDSRMSDINKPEYVQSEGPGQDNNGELSMHPRLTRVGLSLDRWDLGSDFTGEGTLEVDFENGGSSAQSIIRVRHAYLSVSLADKVEVLAGQTWDLISPLFPAANNDSLMWNAGNTGAWRPQLRITATPTGKTRVAVAAGMTGAVDNKDMDGDGRQDGIEAGTPMLQFLIEHRMRLLGDTPTRFGVWGHVGKEQLADGTDYSTSSVGAHAFVPLSKRFTVLGEIFGGKNLSDIRGGIGNGVNLTTGEEIRAVGGWAELAFVANERHMLASGYTIDQAYSEDLEAGDRDRNTTFYLVHRYRPHKALQIGLEYVRWSTVYKAARDGQANRFNVHFSMFF